MKNTDLKILLEQRANLTKKNNPKFAQSVDEIIANAKEFNEGKSALKVGDEAPLFTLPDPIGNGISLKDITTKGPVIVTFYRGSWCPYCNLQLRSLTENIEEIHSLGAELVAISPQTPDESLTIVEKQSLGFAVLSDQDSIVAKSFGVTWQVPELLREHMKNDRGLDLDVINNGDGSILPIPATFIINREGVISWRFLDLDYRLRASAQEIIEHLKKLEL